MRGMGTLSAHSFSLTSYHRPDMTEILSKRTENCKSSSQMISAGGGDLFNHKLGSTAHITYSDFVSLIICNYASFIRLFSNNTEDAQYVFLP